MTTDLQYILDLGGKGLSPAGWDATSKSIAALGIAAGMAYLHSKNIIHRDLKPANVLLAADYTPRVGDFGFSKFISTTRQVQMTLGVGSPLYMAPELHTGEDNYSFPVDVYAYGMMIYVMMTGTEPFNGLSPYQVASTIAEGKRPDIPRGMSEFYRELIVNCWQEIPSERPTFEDIVSDPDRFKLDGCDDDEFEAYKVGVLGLR
jgi:serine/threonine protein kinase